MCIASRRAASAGPSALTSTPILFAGGWTYAASDFAVRALEARRAADDDVLADLRDSSVRSSSSARDGLGAVLLDDVEHALGERPELLVLRDRLGLGADRDDRALRVVDAREHDAFGRLPARALAGLRHPPLPQELFARLRGRRRPPGGRACSPSSRAPVRSRSSLTSAAVISVIRRAPPPGLGGASSGTAPRRLGGVLRCLQAPLRRGAPRLRAASASAGCVAGCLARAAASAAAALRRLPALGVRLRLFRGRRLELLGRDLLLPGLDRVGDRPDDQRAGLDRVVVARNDVVGLVRIAVRVDEGDHRQAEPLRLAHRDRLLAEVDRRAARPAAASCRRRRRGGFRAARARRASRCAPSAAAARAGPPRSAGAARAGARCGSEIVRQFVSRPPSQRWFTYGMPTRFACSSIASCACFFVPTKSIVPPRSREVARERGRLLEQLERLLEIDDVDAPALAEDEAAHLGIPAAGLVAEMDSGLQELSHGYDGQWNLLWFECSTAGGVRVEPLVKAAPPPVRPAGTVTRSLDSSRCPAIGRDRRPARAEAATRPRSGSPVNGCSNASRAACRNWRPRRLVRNAVDRVADDRQVDRGQVHADLVRPARLEPHVQQRVSRRAARRPRSGSPPRAACRCRATGASDRPGRGRSAPRSVPARSAAGRGRAPGSGARPRGARTSS